VLTQPKEETFRIVETEMTMDELAKARPFNLPKMPSTGEAGPKERP
jgi:hypothetical protein